MDMVFFEHVLVTMEKYNSVSAELKNNGIKPPNFISLSDSAVVSAIDVIASEDMQPIAGMSTSRAKPKSSAWEV